MNKNIMAGDVYSLKNSYKNEHIRNVLVFSIEKNGKCLVLPLFSDWEMATDGDYWLPGPEWLDTRCVSWSKREVIDGSLLGFFLGRISSEIMNEIKLIESGKCSYEHGVPVLYGTGDMREKFRKQVSEEIKRAVNAASPFVGFARPLIVFGGIAAVILIVIAMFFVAKTPDNIEKIDETKISENIEPQKEVQMVEKEKAEETSIPKPFPMKMEEMPEKIKKEETLKFVEKSPIKNNETQNLKDLKLNLDIPKLKKGDQYQLVSNRQTPQNNDIPEISIEPLRTQLIQAVIANDIEKVKELLKQKADPFEMDRNGKRAFDFAKEYQRKEILEMFEEVE